MTLPWRRTARWNRQSARSSLSKNCRRHGAGNDAFSMAWISSRSSSVTGAIVSFSRILFLPQLDLRLGQPHVDRSHVAVVFTASALLDLHRAARTAEGDVVALQKVGDTDDARAVGRRAEVRGKLF